MQQKIQEYPFDLGQSYFRITTQCEQTQKWFDYALLWNYGFNHEESLECAKKAIKNDPQCSISYFIAGLAVGINYNNCPEKLGDKQAQMQYEFWEKANQYKKLSSKLEQDIINAYKFKVGDGKTLEHKEMDKEYSKHLGILYKKYNDLYDQKEIDDQQFCFIIELYAESLMNLTPWRMWVQQPENMNEKYGDPYENTLMINKILTRGLKIMPNHIAFRHLYIHLHELSLTPETALCENFPLPLMEISKELGHLNHMSSHIDIQCGRYWNSILANQIGVESDKKYIEYREKVGLPKNCFYILYYGHNIHFLTYAAMFQGNYQIAQKESLKFFDLFDFNFLKDDSYLKPNWAMMAEAFMPVIIHVLVRFGKWEQLIEDPFFSKIDIDFIIKNKDIYQCTLSTYYYGQAIAYAVMAGKYPNQYNEYIEKSLQSEKKFSDSYEQIEDNRIFFHNTVKSILAIGKDMARGEILYRQKKYEEAFQFLRESVKKYDNMDYNEPWGWMVPSRHALAALQLEYGISQNDKQLIENAEKEYRIDLGEKGDLKRCVAHPNNIWSLVGLKICIKYLGKSTQEENKKIDNLIQEQLQHSDIEINASCLCSLQKII